MSDPKNPQPGELVIDASELSADIVDLPPGGMMGKRRAQEGFDEAYQELVTNQATRGAAAGIPDSDIERMKYHTSRIDRIHQFLGPVRKLVELLEESAAHHDHERHGILSDAAASVDRRMKKSGSEDLEAYYEKTRTYRSAIAMKGVKTRQKAEAEAEAEAGTAAEATP